MKITDIEYKTYKEIQNLPQFDTKSMPIKPKWYLQLLAWVLALPETFLVKSRINKVNMKGLKGPYVLLCNHNSFLDFKVATRAVFPRRSNYIVAVDGFIGREKIMRNVGCFLKRKFVSDISLAKQVKHSLNNNKVICQIYPEARYSLVGTSSPLPNSLGKLVKWLNFPVVTLVSHGHHLRQPFWNLRKRKIKTYSVLTQILTKDDLKELDINEINQIINKHFKYDDYQYQLDNKIKITEPFRAEGLHKPLYKCPHCLTEHKMNSKDHIIYCESCGIKYELKENGSLNCLNEDGKFNHIPTWFEWQRDMVLKEIKDSNYDVTLDVTIDILPNSDGFYRVGDGTLTHNKEGFKLVHDDFTVFKPAKNTFGVHIEYDYFGRGDGISFSTDNETYYMYPTNQDYNITKFHFAAEELYKYLNTQKEE